MQADHNRDGNKDQQKVIKSAHRESRGASSERIKCCKEKLLPEDAHNNKKDHHQQAEREKVAYADPQHVTEEEVEEIAYVVWDR